MVLGKWYISQGVAQDGRSKMEDKLIVAVCRYDILYNTSCHDYK